VSSPVQTEVTGFRRSSAAGWVIEHWQLELLGLLTLWLYWPTLGHLVTQWATDRDFSHGFFVPLFSGFVVWQDRDRLARIPRQPSWSGAIVLVCALAVLVVGQLGAELFLSRCSLLFLLAGLVILFGGWNLFRGLLFPWAFLFLMVPIPAIIFNQITFPLQILASKVAAATLPLFGVPVLRQGNIMVLASLALEVADACSGIRSLMSLATLAIIYGYFMEPRLSVRYVLAAAALPIAVLANSFRVITTGLMVQYWDPDKAEGQFHAWWGWIVFVSSLAMLFGAHSLIRWIWPNERRL
jgi:exosortase